jgi:hypothetical protein
VIQAGTPRIVGQQRASRRIKIGVTLSPLLAGRCRPLSSSGDLGGHAADRQTVTSIASHRIKVSYGPLPMDICLFICVPSYMHEQANSIFNMQIMSKQMEKVRLLDANLCPK